MEIALQVGAMAPTNKPRRWVVGRYFGKFNKFRNDRWVSGDRGSGAYLVRFSWTGIERHVPVKGAASPDDPALASYWAERRTKIKPPLNGYTLRLLARQAGRCRYAETTCCPPSSHPSLPNSGNNGGCTYPQGNSSQLPDPSRATRPTAR